MLRRTLELSDATTVESGWSVTPVARVSTTVHAGSHGGFLHQRLRPLRVHVVDPDGRTNTIRIHDKQRTVQWLVVAVFAALFGLQTWRRRA